MAADDFEALYHELVEESRTHNEAALGPLDAERRKVPRLRVDATELTVRAKLQVSTIDVSAGGVAFHSNFPVQRGQPLNISVGDLFSVEAEVVSCILEEADPEFTHTLFRVQCRFSDHEQGKYLLVMVKELERRKALPAGEAP